MVKFKRWKVLPPFLLLLFILFEMDPCLGRRARQVENMLEDFDIESSLPRFSQPIPNVTVTIGKDALLPCVVDNLRSYKVAFVRVDTQTILTIHQAVITRNPRITLSYSDHRSWFLQIKNTHESDRGFYMCQINTDPMRSLMGYLEVVVPPQIIDQDTSTDLVAKEGSNVTLHCKAKGHPEPYVMWRREDNQEIQYNGNQVNVIDGEVFFIMKISRLHMGAFLCIASNGIPPSISKRVEVKVQFPPQLTIPQQLEGAYVGQDVVIECQTEAHPKSINYWTTEKGDMIVSGDKYESFLVDSGYKMYMRLKVRNLTKVDFGSFKCVAKNSLGETDGNIKLYEIPAPSTTASTTVKTTPMPSKKPKKKSNKVNEVVIESGYDEWSNNKGQPSYEDLQNSDMSSTSGGSSANCQSRLFLVQWMELGVGGFWSLFQNNYLNPSSSWPPTTTTTTLFSDATPPPKQEKHHFLVPSRHIVTTSTSSSHNSHNSCNKNNINSRHHHHLDDVDDDGGKNECEDFVKSPIIINNINMSSSSTLYSLGFYYFYHYFYKCGINLLCLSLTLILIHFN